MKQVFTGLALTVVISLVAWGVTGPLFVTPTSEIGTSPNESVRLDAPTGSEQAQ